MKEEKLLPVGTRVFDVRYGWGEIQMVYTGDTFLLLTWFYDYEISTSYTLDGKVLKENLTPITPMLSLTEYTLENGGFTPISDYWNKPKVGDWGYFWDFEKEGSTQHIILGKLLEIKDATHPYVSCSGLCWRSFSHDIPEHIKQQMQQ